MVEDLDKAGRGRASGGAAQLNFDTALEAWSRLRGQEKGRCAGSTSKRRISESEARKSRECG